VTRARDTILQEIAREEERLAEFERAREVARARRESLQSELEGATTPTPVLLPLPLATNGKTPQTSAEKVRLFRPLFRGREDIFPTRLVSKKTGKPGYAPECSVLLHRAGAGEHLMPKTTKGKRRRWPPGKAELDRLIEDATVDAYDESEQRVGFYTMLEEHLSLPFETEILGISVIVERIEMTDDEQVVAICRRGRSRQRVPIFEVPLPKLLPEGGGVDRGVPPLGARGMRGYVQKADPRAVHARERTMARANFSGETSGISER
jgi:TOTE conflict system, Archaeo-Eukaryotic Primase domain/Calcium binding